MWCSQERMAAQYAETEKLEELRMLKQQRDLLRKLVEQQKQVTTVCIYMFICIATSDTSDSVYAQALR